MFFDNPDILNVKNHDKTDKDTILLTISYRMEVKNRDCYYLMRQKHKQS